MQKDKEKKLLALNLEKEKALNSIYTFSPKVSSLYKSNNKMQNDFGNKSDFYERAKK